PLLIKYGPYIGLTESRIKIGQYLFLRHGIKVVIAARFIALLRSLAGILAGANCMPVQSFLIANAVGSATWAIVYGVTAYLLGDQLEKMVGAAVVLVVLAVIALVIGAAVFIARHEQRLAIEAERALPGPLRPGRQRRASRKPRR